MTYLVLILILPLIFLGAFLVWWEKLRAVVLGFRWIFSKSFRDQIENQESDLRSQTNFGLFVILSFTLLLALCVGLWLREHAIA